jgi:hypothetical protein
MPKFISLLISLFIFNTAYAAALPISSALTPRSHARHWIEAHADKKKLTPKEIKEIKNIYERLCNAFNNTSGALQIDEMIECWHLHHQIQSISEIKPKGDFQLLEEKLLHFTLWRVFQKTYPHKINEALNLWHLQQKLFRRYNPM